MDEQWLETHRYLCTLKSQNIGLGGRSASQEFAVKVVYAITSTALSLPYLCQLWRSRALGAFLKVGVFRDCLDIRSHLIERPYRL